MAYKTKTKNVNKIVKKSQVDRVNVFIRVGQNKNQASFPSERLGIQTLYSS